MQNNSDRAHPEDSAQPSANPESTPIVVRRRDRSPVTVDAHVFGEWAAHRMLAGDGDGWVVTHVETTLRLPSALYSESDIVEYNAEGDEALVYEELDRDEAITIARALGAAGHFELHDEDRRFSDTDNRWFVESIVAEALAEVWS